MKIRKHILTLLLLLVSSCIKRSPNPEGQEVRDMMSSTVKITVTLKGSILSSDGDGGAKVSPEMIEWYGSGVIVATDYSKGKGQSVILSAAHVVDVDPLIVGSDNEGRPTLFAVKSIEKKIIALDGTVCDAETIYVDEKNDVGAMVAFCVPGPAAEIATEVPDIGVSVTTSGASLGFHPPGVFVVTDGRYVGAMSEDDSQHVYTFAATNGQSGSAVYYNGKVVSIISKKIGGFEHVVFGVNLSNVRKAYSRALEVWNVN